LRHVFSAAARPAVFSILVIGLVGALAFASGQPWLFPSLGPTVFLQAVHPGEPASRPWNTLVGHALGVAAGFGALLLFGALDAPSAFDAAGLSPQRAGATAAAVGATIFFQLLSNARHPPAAATTMLITLGAIRPGWPAAGSIMIGVTLVAALGLGAKRFVTPRAAD
jgi:hypothetical protein